MVEGGDEGGQGGAVDVVAVAPVVGVGGLEAAGGDAGGDGASPVGGGVEAGAPQEGRGPLGQEQVAQSPEAGAVVDPVDVEGGGGGVAEGPEGEVGEEAGGPAGGDLGADAPGLKRQCRMQNAE